MTNAKSANDNHNEANDAAAKAANIGEVATDLPRAIPSQPPRWSPMLLLPLIVAVVVGILWWQESRERGISISIAFASAGGLSEGTTIKFRDVVVGRVESVGINSQSDDVVVKARIDQEFGSRLLHARFWIVRPLLRVHEVSGLETLFNGQYIAMDEGGSAHQYPTFQGLREPPVDTRGLTVLLEADRVGSVRRGSPILFRQFQVGTIAKKTLDPETRSILFEGIVEPEYAHLVCANTCFWNASGVDFSLTNGLDIQAESLDTLISGGVAFDLLTGREPGAEVEPRARFTLHENEQLAQSSKHQRSEQFVLFFQDSIRGLSEGAPVFFHGVQVGEVTDIHLEQRGSQLRVPVAVRLDYDQVQVSVPSDGDVRTSSPWEGFIERGLKAQLELGNLLTGSLVVSLRVAPEAQGHTEAHESLASLPTMRSTIDQVMNVMNESVPALFARIEQTLEIFEERMRDFSDLASDESKTMELLRETLDQISSTARSVRVMADAIEQDPQSFIFGK